MYSCDACPRRATCRSICPEIERLLPPADGRPRASLNAIDRSVVWRVQENEDRLTRRQRVVARLYFRFGWSQARIASSLKLNQSTVARICIAARKKVRKLCIKTA